MFFEFDVIYETVTKTLVEEWRDTGVQADQWTAVLAPIAYDMHERAGESMLTHQELTSKLTARLGDLDGLTTAAARRDAVTVFMERVNAMWSRDALLGPALAEGLRTLAMSDEVLGDREMGRNIRPAPFINHTDQELQLVEAIVGREPPFIFPKADYSGPRRGY